MESSQKYQRREKQKNCNHRKRETMRTFSNGTEHLEVRCDRCEKFFGYKSQGKYDTAILPINRVSGLYYEDDEGLEPEHLELSFMARQKKHRNLYNMSEFNFLPSES